jgi:hypothetical protein
MAMASYHIHDHGMVWYGAPPTPWTAIVATRWWQLDRAPAEHAQTDHANATNSYYLLLLIDESFTVHLVCLTSSTPERGPDIRYADAHLYHSHYA